MKPRNEARVFLILGFLRVSFVMQILLMSDMAEFDDLRLELQKLKKKKQSTDLLGKVGRIHKILICSNLTRNCKPSQQRITKIGR